MTVPISGSFSRRRSRQSSSSRKARSGPGLVAGCQELVGRRRLRRVGRGDRQLAQCAWRGRSTAGDVAGSGWRRRRSTGSSGPSVMPGPVAGPIGRAASSRARCSTRFLELAGRAHLVDEAPVHGALAAHAFGQRAEVVGDVAPHLALVDDARQAAGAGQHAQQRRLRQRHRRACHRRPGGSRRRPAPARSRRRRRCR